MHSNDGPSSYEAHRSRSYPENHRETAVEDTVLTKRLQVERKSFVLSLKENPRGRFLRITEDVKGRRANIIIPDSGLKAFSELVAAMAAACAGPDSGERSSD